MNSEYWEDRLANEIWAQYNSIEEKNMAILNMYREAEKNIVAEITKLERRGNDLTRSQKYRINHLESLKKEIEKICEKIGDDVESSAKKGLFDAIKRNQENISDVLSTSFSKPTQKVMEQMLNTPWHGSYFSKRLWNDTGKLANELNDIAKRGITEGKTIAEISFQLSNRLHKSMNDVHRLVRTETINTLNRSSLDGYKKSNIKYVRWWAAIDERSCEVCGANHEKIYPIDKAPILPCHPNCRCTYIPVFEDELNDTDIAELSQFENEPYYLKTKKNYKFSDGTKSLKDPKIKDAIIFVNDENVEFVYPMHYDKSKQKIDPRKAMTIFEELPKEVREVIKKVEFADYHNPKDELWKKRYGIDDFVSFAVSGDDNIVFWSNDHLNEDTLTDVAIKRTYIHESGHIVDKGKVYSFSRLWKEAVEKDEEFPTEYAESDIREDFAESVAEFFTNNEEFKVKFPNRYKYIKELYAWKKK